MSSPTESGGLRVVSSKKRMALSAEMFRPFQAQAGLFDEQCPWTIVFVSVPDLPEGAFGEIIRCAEPAFVFDLRLAPRFDMGRLNRERAFELFEKGGGNRDARETPSHRWPTASCFSPREKREFTCLTS